MESALVAQVEARRAAGVTLKVAEPADFVRQIFIGRSVRRQRNVDNAMLIGVANKLTIKLRPAVGFNLTLKRTAYVAVGTRPQFLRHKILRPVAQSALDIVAVDHEVLPIVGAAADDHMHMGVISIPVIHADPFELRTEILFHLRHQFAGEVLQVFHIDRIFR